MNTQNDILLFWKDIEVFALPDLPSGAKNLDINLALPWNLPFTPQKNSTWRHLVYLGKHRKDKIVSILEVTLEDNSTKSADWLEKVTGNTCMAVIILNEQGRLLGDTAYLQASYLHGIKCLQDGRPLSEINERLEEVQEKFRERHPYSQEAENLEDMSFPAITLAHLKKEIAALNELNIKGLFCDNNIYVQSIQVSKNAKGDSAFLNSFYLDDLNTLINSKEKFGKGITQYLGSNIDQDKYIDILTNAEAFFETINPAKIPAGRWPSNPSNGLYAAQVAAVNTSLTELRQSGVIGINGPPGTGKTTLLSDIITEVTVLRAESLLQKDISNLFSKGERIERENNFAYHFPVKDDVFSDTGIVVASNNNAAVENISKQLPDDQKIDRNSFPDAAYFIDHTQGLSDKESWGLLAVALGNSENKAAFRNNFWYKNGDKPGFANFLQSLYNNLEEEDHTVEYLEQYQKTEIELKELLKGFNEFKKLASHFHRSLPAFLIDHKLKLTVENEVDQLIKLIDSLNYKELSLGQRLSALEKRISEVQYSIQVHESLKPRFFFFKKLFNTEGFKIWNAPFILFLEEHTDLSTKRMVSNQELDNISLEIAKNEQGKNLLQEQLKQINERIRKYNKEKQDLHERYAIPYKNIPDENLWIAFEHDKNSFHKSNPWSSVKINKLRSQIFIKSLKLHEYAILRNAKQFKNNIGLLLELIDGKAVVSKSIMLSLWQSFFFCIPVVSTSLASVGRLFNGLGKEDIGWLLLDEAGQATPQSAAGIIYRSKRSIIIGDPLQIQPVITIPSTLVNVLNSRYKNDSIWSPLRCSAQTLADRVTHYGTWMNGGEEDDVWSGFPLRAHRRCNNPMFDISNEIAYSNQMVKALDDIPFDCVLGDSRWFDVNGSHIQNKQVVQEEIELLKEKISTLGKVTQHVFVISPYKSVADYCRNELQYMNTSIQCGTIHTFQGKEADIVFLVLGSDPNKPGSRQWASQKPNMLNVALTRAKYRFYVIGSKKHWKGHSYFDVLAKSL